jgi:uncharacterized protein
MRLLIRQHPVASFLVLFYALGWAVFVPALLGTRGLGILPVEIPLDPFRLLSIVLFAIIPIIVTRIVGGPSAVRSLVGQLRHVRVGIAWYLVALFGAPVVVLPFALLLRGPGVLTDIAAHLGAIPTMYLLTIVVLALLGNLWEELSWSAYVTDRLQARMGPLRASLLVAPLFGLYHLPLFFVIAGLDDGTSRIPLDQLPLYLGFLLVVFSVPMRVLLTWAYNGSGRSLPVVAMFHASINATASAAILGAFFAGLDGLVVYAALALLAVVVIGATRGRLGQPTQAPVVVAPPQGAVAI